MNTLKRTTLFLFGFFLNVCKGEDPFRIPISAINVRTNVNIEYLNGNMTADKVNDGVLPAYTDEKYPRYLSECKCCAGIVRPYSPSWVQLTLDKIYLVERVIIWGPGNAGTDEHFNDFFLSMGLWAQSSHEEQFTSKNRTIAEKRLYPPHQIKFVHVRAAENSAALILCEIMIYRQADCLIGSYSVNCSKKCRCLVGPCDSVTGACGNGGCIDGWLGISCNENPIRIAISSINVTTNAHIYNTDTTNADKVNDGVNGKSLDPWNCKCCAVLTLSSWLQLTLDKIYLVERVLVYANDISGSVDNITLSIGLREESLHDEHFTWKSKTTAEKLLHPPREIQFVRFTWSDYSQILCEIMIYRQADCPIGKYSVNCAKQCHCLVGPCDSVTGACGKELCEDEWKGTACNETKADTKLSSTVIWIATFLGLFLLLVGVTIAWLCIRRKKIGTVERTLENVQQNDLQPSYCPQEFHDNNYAQYEVVPDNISEREATPMYTSFQMKDKHLYTGLQNSSPMSPASPYVISESETVEKNYAEADDNASTSEAKNKLTEEKENDNNGETNYADFELLENDKQKSVHKEYYFVK